MKPSVSMSSSITPEAMVRCCHLPLGSVKRRSTQSISSSLMRERIVARMVRHDRQSRSLISSTPEQMPLTRRWPGDDDTIRAWTFRFPTGGEESAPSRIFHSAVEGGGEPVRAPNDCAAAGREGVETMRSALLWLIGVPIPIILLLALCTHHL